MVVLTYQVWRRLDHPQWMAETGTHTGVQVDSSVSAASTAQNLIRVPLFQSYHPACKHCHKLVTLT